MYVCEVFSAYLLSMQCITKWAERLLQFTPFTGILFYNFIHELNDLPVTKNEQFSLCLPRTEVINGQNCEGTKVVPKFRARTLNRKVVLIRIASELLCLHTQILKGLYYAKIQILSSKGDMGVFRTDKREVTIPMVLFCAYIKWIKIRVHFC